MHNSESLEYHDKHVIMFRVFLCITGASLIWRYPSYSDLHRSESFSSPEHIVDPQARD